MVLRARSRWLAGEYVDLQKIFDRLRDASFVFISVFAGRCYLEPELLAEVSCRDELVVVVTPLQALVYEQVSTDTRAGARAAFRCYQLHQISCLVGLPEGECKLHGISFH